MSRHSDQKETEKRCQRDLSVPSSKCRRRHNILYTHIIHFVYPRYLLLPLLLPLCDRSFFIKTFFFSPLFLSLFSVVHFSYSADRCRSVERFDWVKNFFDSHTRCGCTKWLRHGSSDSLTLAGACFFFVSFFLFLLHLRLFFGSSFCFSGDGESNENKCQRCFTCTVRGIFIVVRCVYSALVYDIVT